MRHVLPLVMVLLAPGVSRAQAPPDTGWVEIGGTTGFGADDPFADLPSAEPDRDSLGWVGAAAR